MNGASHDIKANGTDQLEIIFDSVIDIIFLIAIESNDRYRFTSVNRAFTQATGLTPEMVVGLYVNDIIPEESREMVLSNYKKAIQIGQTVEWEETSVYPAGTKTGIVSVTPVLNENKECTMLVGTVHDITDRKKADEERKSITEQLMVEKELSEIIINNIPGIFYMFTDQGRYVRWNKNHETVPGYTTEEMENMFPLNFFEGEDKKLIEQRIGRVFTDGIADAEAKFMTKDGRKIPYYFTGKKVIYNNSPHLLGVGLDMTERLKMEEDLRHAEIKFRTLVEKSQVGVYIVQNRKFVYVNPRFAEIFGYKDNELIGLDPITSIISEEYQDIVRANVRARFEGKTDSVHYEVSGKRKDGTINRVEFFGSLIDYEGLPTVMGTMVDITQRKLAEEALQKSEANLHSIFDTTDTKYVLLDNNFQIVSYNEQSADFFRLELQAEIATQNNFISYFPKERQTELYNKMKQVLGGRSFTYESNYLQPDGAFHWYYVRMFPIRDQDNKIFGLINAVSDITEKKRLEEEIVNQKVEEQKKMTRAVLNAQESERNKIGQELHDNVNQILIGSKIHLGLISGATGKTAELISNSIELIDKAIREIQSLTRQQVTPHKEVDLHDLVQSLVNHLNNSTKINSAFTYKAGKSSLSDDLKLNIYRIIQEATNNIIKHAHAKNATISIAEAEDHLDIQIIDDGKGFNTSRKKTKGIGLSNILNRVESYNGNVFFKSSPGEGCRIDLSIPF